MTPPLTDSIGIKTHGCRVPVARSLNWIHSFEALSLRGYNGVESGDAT